MQHKYDVIVIGGGPAGYAAALYTARAGLSTLVIEKMCAGGQMALTTQVENYPGFHEGIDGLTLGMNMQLGAQRFGAESLIAEVISAEIDGKEKRIRTEVGDYIAKAVIVATGAGHRKLGIANETELTGRGVAYCAACDGILYKDKTVAVVGGGNSAAEEAILLSRIARKVYLIHRRDRLRAAKVCRARLMNAENVEFRWNSIVTELLHDDKLTGARLRNVITGEEGELELDGLFVSVGRDPNTALFKGQLELDAAGHIIADESTRTNISGVYAAGDVRTKAVRQIVTAAADGVVAAHNAEEYLSGD